MTVSTQASVALETVAQASDMPLWFQLYLRPRWEDALTLVHRAEQAVAPDGRARRSHRVTCKGHNTTRVGPWGSREVNAGVG